MRRGVVLTLAGLAVGTAGTLLLTRTLEGLLYGVPPRDPATLGALAAVIVCVGLAACAVPARRASRVDPAIALRAE